MLILQLYTCKSLHLEKRFQESFKMSVNHENLDVDFVLQHFILCLFVKEDDDETEL